jgi:hypothetical protein
MSIKRALQQLPTEAVHAAIDKELTKVLRTYSTLRPITRSYVESTAIILRSKLLMKEKLDGRITCRMPLDGSAQPTTSYSSTFAGTSTTQHRTFITACYQANCAKRGITSKLRRVDFDVPAAFLHNGLPRSETGGHQIITTMPADLPEGHIATARQLFEVIGAQYGLKQSNAIFSNNFITTMTNANFNPTLSDPMTFFKRCSLNPLNSLALTMHVDDGSIISQSDALIDEAKAVLQKRYGPIEFQEPGLGVCGVQVDHNADNSLTMHYDKYITKFLHRIGMDAVPPPSPSLLVSTPLRTPPL